MSVKKITSLVLMIFLCLSVSGCGVVLLGGAAAGGTYVYVAGKATQKYNADLGTTYKSAIAACKELNLKIDSAKKRLSDASIKAVDVDTTVYIDLSSSSSKVTEVTVRYGILGDEQASSRILAAIKKNL
ncbi:DUF3568 domain-containing protein [Maridesulfovibrio sp.]|uniref:DUF3568 domain-containing protein n=1 Tax=Maridesulfovibrio sp. TaxID=2795000 RepID=UPI002A1883BF|nr:DUF3568 domain-containing protein [Maridesulfovibrio sp.]